MTGQRGTDIETPSSPRYSERGVSRSPSLTTQFDRLAGSTLTTRSFAAPTRTNDSVGGSNGYFLGSRGTELNVIEKKLPPRASLRARHCAKLGRHRRLGSAGEVVRAAGRRIEWDAVD